MSDDLRQRLDTLRHAVLKLHKSVLESEKASYQETVGPIQSPNHFLQLLTTDPWFAWLQPLSQLIVSMDEALDNKEEPLTPEIVEALFNQTGKLLVGAENADGFSGHYYEALQRDPDVVMAHAEVTKLRKPQKPPA